MPKLPDNAQWENRLEIVGSTGNVYIVAQHKTSRWWACSCNGWKSRKNCKHLKSMGLPGSYMPFELKKSGFNDDYKKVNKTGKPEDWEKALDHLRPPEKLPEKHKRQFDFGDEEEKNDV